VVDVGHDFDTYLDSSFLLNSIYFAVSHAAISGTTTDEKGVFFRITSFVLEPISFAACSTSEFISFADCSALEFTSSADYPVLEPDSFRSPFPFWAHFMGLKK